MCDNTRTCRCCSENFANNNSFYYQYVQQHAQMMRWIQNLHSNVSYNQPNGRNCPCCQEQKSNFPRTVALYNPYPVPSYISQQRNQMQTDHLYPKDMADVKEISDEKDFYSDDDELEFNVDAMLAMRAARAENAEKEDEESFELINGVTDEEFEYVELNPFGRLDKKCGVKQHPNTKADILQEKEVNKFLYGDDADMIAGLETSVAINFERLCDVHQPHLWPVLPLRL